MTKCSIPWCTNKGRYSIYELLMDGTKVWRTNLCKKHEADIAARSGYIREHAPKGTVWKELKGGE